MAKCGMLAKLKSTVMKKWTSFGRISSSYNNNGRTDEDMSNKHYLPVYVGKSLRRYLVDSETLANPIFRGLVERSSLAAGMSCEESRVVIASEVVLFEHLLWMLHNCDKNNNNELEADADHWQVSELVEFYAC